MLPMVSAPLPVFVKVTVCEALVVPTAWVPYDKLVAESATAGTPTSPVPLSVIVCGDPAASSVMVMAAVSGPVVVGSKCPRIMQFAPAARAVPQSFANPNEEAFVPVTAMLPKVSVPLPVFVKVTVCEALGVPIAWVPYDRLVAESDIAGLPTVPVPLREIVCGDPVALSVMVTAAVIAPVDVGAKCPWMEQLAPAAMAVPQLLANPNEEAFAPVSVMLPTDNAKPPVLVKVTVCDVLDAPTETEPKPRLVADRDTAGGVASDSR